MQNEGKSGALSRRDLLAAMGAIAAARSASAFQTMPVYVYIGTYTDRGRGIYLYRQDPSSGALTLLKTYNQTPNPSALAISPNGRYLYAANEVSNFQGGTTGSASAFAIDRATGELTLINSVSSGGGGPAHLSVDPSGKFVHISNYGGGSISVLPIESNGGLAAATDTQAHTGPIGPTRAAYGWPGSFAISGHDRPHAHMVEADPSGKFVLSSDLGTDRIFIWKLDAATGKLTANDQQPFLQALGGAGPRHFVWAANGKWFYQVNEEDSTVTFSMWDATKGVLTPKQTLAALPANFAGTNFTSGIMLAPDGKFLYTLNRLFDSVAIFEIDQTTGEMTTVGWEWTRGSYPRELAIDPAGKFMYVLNQRSDNTTVFRVEDGGRKLTFTGMFIPVGNPSSIVFLR
jgi:6-phosphogluconolactonase (cycloisomerase 2 family)